MARISFNRRTLWALLALLSLCVLLLPRLPVMPDCCQSTEQRPSCCPTANPDDNTPTAQSTCCQHLPDDTITATQINPKHIPELQAPVWVVPNTFALIFREEFFVDTSSEQLYCPQTGPPRTVRLYLQKQTFLL